MRLCCTVTKESLKIDHIVDRLGYATMQQDFDWRNVIFSNEAVVSTVLPICIAVMATDTMNTSWQDFTGRVM